MYPAQRLGPAVYGTARHRATSPTSYISATQRFDGQRIKKLSWWHESIIDWMILRPEGTLRQCAAELGCSQPWLSIIVGSDLFQARLTQRRAEHASTISATVNERLSGIATQTLEGIAERIERERDKIALGELRETATMALNALGYSARSHAAAQAPQHGNVYNFNGPTHISRDVLAAARERMRLAQPATEPAPAAPALPRPTFDNLVEHSHNDDNADPLPAPGSFPAGRDDNLG